MSLSVGIFDIFTYAIPGSLYLVLGGYVAERLGWFHVAALGDVPVVLLIGGIVVASYVLGQLTYVVGTGVDRLVPFWQRGWSEARKEFLARIPSARGRHYVGVHGTVLTAAVEAYDREAAQEIHRLRAVGLMVRNCCVPLAAGAVTAAVEAFAGHRVGAAVVCAVLLAGAAVSALQQNGRLRHWAALRTLEVCYWIPGIDEALGGRRDGMLTSLINRGRRMRS